jgi:hypothetical protein
MASAKVHGSISPAISGYVDPDHVEVLKFELLADSSDFAQVPASGVRLDRPEVVSALNAVASLV